MNQKTKLLKELGLKDSDIQIYLFLLQNKKATVLEISRGTGLARTNVYHHINPLISAGLIGQAIDKGKKYLYPESPENLVRMIQTKEKTAEQAAELLGEDFSKDRYESKIRFGYGKEGFKKFALETLSQKNKTLYEIVSFRSLMGHADKRFMNNYWKKRVERNIYVQALVSQNEKELVYKSSSKESDKKLLREVRFLPESVKIEFSQIVYVNKVHFFGSPEEGYSFVFESSSLANTTKNLFLFLWEVSEPIH